MTGVQTCALPISHDGGIPRTAAKPARAVIRAGNLQGAYGHPAYPAEAGAICAASFGTGGIHTINRNARCQNLENDEFCGKENDPVLHSARTV